MDWNYSAPSCNNYICQVTTCLWVLQHKHHSQFGNVLCWHSQKNGFIYQEVSFLNFVLSHLNSSFFTPVLPLSSLLHLGFHPPSHSLLCVAQTASRWSLPEVSLFWKKPHQRMRLTWKDCAQHKRSFFFHWHLGVTQLYTANMCVCVVHVYSLYMWRFTHTHIYKLTLQRYQLSAWYCLPLFWASRSCFQTMSSNLKYSEYF